jgi:hypothetical protein
MAIVTLFLDKFVVLHLAKSTHLQNRTFLTVYSIPSQDSILSQINPNVTLATFPSHLSLDLAGCLPGFRAK